jgi:hypothetical protein
MQKLTPRNRFQAAEMDSEMLTSNTPESTVLLKNSTSSSTKENSAADSPYYSRNLLKKLVLFTEAPLRLSAQPDSATHAQKSQNIQKPRGELG